MTSNATAPAPSYVEERAAYIAGLRMLADALAADPELALPWEGGRVYSLTVFTETRAQVAAYARLMSRAEKSVRDDSDAYGFSLSGYLDGLRLKVHAPREAVCRRVVKGTREVSKDVPDPEALAAVPLVTVTETVEDVEWECEPLLAEAGAS